MFGIDPQDIIDARKPPELTPEECKEIERRRILEELELTSVYVDSLSTIEVEEGSPPNFLTVPIYNNTLNADQITECRKRIASAENAIKNNDVMSLTNLLGNNASMVPHRISYAQRRQQILWVWLDAKRLLLLHRRADFLLSWFQKKLFFDSLLALSGNEFEELILENPDINDFLRGFKAKKSAYQAFLRNQATVKGILQVDIYAYKMLSREYASFGIDKIDGAFPTTLIRREMSEDDVSQLRKIMSQQLLIVAKNTANEYILLEGARQSDDRLIDGINEGEDNEPGMLTRYQNFLMDIKTVKQNFMDWLNGIIKYSFQWDMALLLRNFEEKRAHILSTCQKLVGLQNEVIKNLRKAQQTIQAANNDEEMLSSGIADVGLELPALFMGNLPRNQLLLLAVEQYLNVNPGIPLKKDQALKCVNLLLQRGCSPFTKNQKDETPWKKIKNSSDPALLAGILRNTVTCNPLAEKLVSGLLTFCEEAIKNLNSNLWCFFNSDKTKRRRLLHVATLIETLNNGNYAQLIAKITEIRLVNNTYIPNRSSLNLLLDNIIKIHDTGSLYFSDKLVAEPIPPEPAAVIELEPGQVENIEGEGIPMRALR